MSQFSEQVKQYLSLHPDNERELMRKFGVSRPVVQGWASGEYQPHPLMQSIVLKFLSNGSRQ